MCDKDKKKRAVFSVDEVEILIQLWGDSSIQRKFASSVRHNVIWEQLASQMKQLDFDRSQAEIKSKVNNLKTEYRKLKPASGSATPNWPYYNAMHGILGQRDVERDELVEDSIISTENRTEEINVETAYSEENENDTETEPTTKRPRMDLERPGPSGLQKNAERSHSRISESIDLVPEYSEEDDLDTTSTTPQSKTKSFQRIPRPSQRKVKEIDQILNFLKAAKERQTQQMEMQNQLLQSLVEQDLAAKERDYRVADAFINTVNVLTTSLLKQDRKSEVATSSRHSSHSPPLRTFSPIPASYKQSIPTPTSFRHSSLSPPRISSPTLTSFRHSSIFPPVRSPTPIRPITIIPAHSGQHPRPRFVYISRPPSTTSPQLSPSPTQDEDEGTNNVKED